MLLGIGLRATYPLIGVKENDSHIMICALSFACANSMSILAANFLITVSLDNRMIYLHFDSVSLVDVSSSNPFTQAA
jgi:hypothetical protein